ncbi:MAG: glycosyltransferase [Pseudomonadota bacterium]
MLNQSILLDLNPKLGLLNDIFQDTTNVFRDSSLSNYIQIAVADVFSEADDKSLFSLDIERLINTDELRAALSAKRYNYLRALNLEGINHALDLSEDFGGVAHYLADQVNTLDAVKIDSDRTRLSLLRCANKRNICHISEDLDKLKLPSNHYDLIVVGELEALALERDAQVALLRRLQASLSARGVLIINVKNRDSINKWVNANSSAANAIPYGDLYRTDYVQEYQRKELLNTLAAANFASIDINASFASGNDCANLFSEDYLTSSPNSINHFYRLGSIDNPEVNEYLLFKNLFENQQRVFDQASRFVVIAGATRAATRAVYDKDFCHFPGTGRQAGWRTITSRNSGAPEVWKQPVYPEKTVSEEFLSQNLSPQPFCKGRLLVDDWLQAIDSNDPRELRELVTEYSEWLQQFSDPKEFKQIAYDLLPFNIVLRERGGNRDYQVIDPEWQLEIDFDRQFVLFRALFWFAFENKSVIRRFAAKNDIPSIALFVVKFMPSVGQVSELQEFVQLEEQIQSKIDNNFRAKAVEHALLQSFDTTPGVEGGLLTCQLLWGDTKSRFDEENSVFCSWENSPGAQKLNIDLPPYSAKVPVLRIDPIASRGLFSLDSLRLLNKKGKAVYSLDSATEIAAAATFVNAEQAKNDEGRPYFVALNSDPHLLFDLSNSDKIDQAVVAQLELSLLHDQRYDAALETLANTVLQQNNDLVRQANTLDQYRAELEFTNMRLDEVRAHRTDLNEMLQDQYRLDQERLRKIRILKQRMVNLNDQLVAQLGRNEEMEDYLMMRPTTRVKRFASRNLNRLRGVAPVADDADIEESQAEEAENQAEEEDPNAFPESGELIGQNTEDYQLWISENSLSDEDIAAAKEEIESFKLKPVFSILVPIYNTDPDYLIPMIRSVQAQIYPHWQLCLVDDASPKGYLRSILEYEAAQDERISIRLNDHNQGISLTTNDALAMASGDYIALLDHDDELSIDALYENAKAINQHPDLGLAYSDEDKMDMEGNRLEPYFKPDYSPDLLDTNNYICHFTVIKKEIVDQVGGFLEGLDGSQDHDIILRAAHHADRVVHIPRILYHWRKIPGSTAVVYDSKSYAWEAGRKAVENCLNQEESGVKVKFGTLKGTYRVFREIQGEPLVSIIVPFKDKPELLDSCLGSILDRTTYTNFEIIGVSNNSELPETSERTAHFSKRDERIRFVEKNIPFNFSAICNYGVEQAKGEYIVLLNNDIEIQSPDWLERLLEHAQRPGIGAVGGKLLFPDGRIQHAGVVAGMVGAAGHPHKFFPDDHIGYHGRLHMVYNVSAVTGAMLMVSKAKYEEVGGLDEEHLAVAYNDIDFCLKLLDKGYLNLFTPHCKATHYESISRGYEDTEEKLNRLKTEQGHFLNRWHDFLEAGDPYYNPNLSLKNERFSLNFKD